MDGVGPLRGPAGATSHATKLLHQRGDLVLDLQPLLLERLQGHISKNHRWFLGLHHLGIKPGVLFDQRVETLVLPALFQDVFFCALQILAKIMGHRHGAPPS
jgi:hypothetical protein